MKFNDFKVLFFCFLILCSFSATKKGLSINVKTQLGSDVQPSLLGEWISIKNYTMPITGLDNEEINKLMRIYCRFGSDICIILKDTIHNPNYTLKRVNASQYFLDLYPRISKEFVGIKKDSIDVITVNAEKIIDPYDVIEVNDKLLIFLDGVFFQYQRPESLVKSNPVLIKEFNFQGNEATFKSPSNIIDSLRGIANSLNHNKRLFVMIQGNTDNSDNNGFEMKTTIDSRNGSVRDLLFARAENISQMLISKLKVSPSQVRISIGRMNYRRSATLMLFKN